MPPPGLLAWPAGLACCLACWLVYCLCTQIVLAGPVISPPPGYPARPCEIMLVMQTWEAVTSRRNVRTFTGDPIPSADLDQILEAGRRSPSSQNWQPWNFILVTDREQLVDLAKTWRGAGHVATSAATIVVIGPPADNPFHRAQLDLGQAIMAMTLVAADLGIGSCHAGVADVDRARQLLGFPADRDWAFLVSLGYPADRPLTPIRNPKRRPFDEVVHRGRW
jgi:nitroreductase